GYTKGDLIKYYDFMAPYILPYLKDRPVTLHRFPDGVGGESFYQKDCPDYAPEWIRTVPVQHHDSGKVVNYIICNDKPTLLWLAAQGSIEIHAWLATCDNPGRPDIAVLDLDPMPGAPFAAVVQAALLLRETLAQFGLTGYPKTSGAEGLHIFIPIMPEYSHQEVARAMGVLAGLVAKVFPQATVERMVRKRGARVYLDFLQNGFGKTMAFPYSIRPIPGAPVSTPLDWPELEQREARPAEFNIETVPERVETKGDVWEGFAKAKQTLKALF
ncbi:MAG: non-homologous end-joining DNA ligase, partial [Firmicutes bacterium]|nr:non-homologous end-joining DNA ligase [Bacillota bacterium]